MFSKESEQKPVRLSAINTIFSCKKVSAATKIQKQPPYGFCKRRSATLLLERGSSITLKISISVTNSEAVVQRSSVKKAVLEISQNSQ